MDKQKEKKKKVLMPFGLRNKLIAAISMLLVSSIMMVSSTYAWFTLSTAPEVKNISTTVAGNGSLEIALMPTDGLLSSITAGAVGSTATLKEKNVKWGNQVVLSEEGNDPYGLSAISLNPARLNYAKATEDATEETFVAEHPLAIAKYGFDGRIAGLDAQNVGVKSKDNGEGFDSDKHGVRAIGELTDNKVVTSAYGYVVDLAMRVNTTGADGTKGKLLLQTEKANRIYNGSNNAETMGGGSTMSFSVPAEANLKAGALKELLGAIRITFVKDYGVSGDGITPEIIGTAKLDTSELKDYTNGKNVTELGEGDDPTKLVVTTEGTAPIFLYKTVTEGENTTEVKLDGTDGNEAILLNAMDKNKAYQISAIVWLDGTAVKNGNVSAAAAQSLTGTLNLQFSTDIKLNPAVNTPLKGE